MDRRALDERAAMVDVDPRAVQAGSPIALTLFDLLADPSSTLRGLLRVSDLFCVRLTCKEAWRCIQHKPLTRLGVLKEATDQLGIDHHVPLLRWCLRNNVGGILKTWWQIQTIGEAGDVELVSELLKGERKSDLVIDALLLGAATAGKDELALLLLTDCVEVLSDDSRGVRIRRSVATGGCIRTAAAIDDDPLVWLRFLPHSLVKGHQPFVDWVLADVEPDAAATYVALAAKSGSLELVKWLYARGYAVGGDTLRHAAASGNVELCKWVVDHGLVPTHRAVEAAVRGGHVQVLDWLSTSGCRCTTELLRRAVHIAGVPVVAWCLGHHADAPDARDLLARSCQNEQGTDVFEYLADHRGFQDSPSELMRAASWQVNVVKLADPFDAATLVKRYGTPLYPEYMSDAVRREDVGRLRFALSQGQAVSVDCYKALIKKADPTLLHEVLLARQVGGAVSEDDRTLISEALCEVKCNPCAKKMLEDHSIVV
jgi:hypothetical protein